MKLKYHISTYILYGLAALLFVYVLSSFVTAFLTVDEIVLESVSKGTYRQSTAISGIVLRNEDPVCAKIPFETVIYHIEDNSRVAKRSVLAYCSESKLSDDLLGRLDTLSQRIASLEKTTSGQILSDVFSIETEIQDQITAYLAVYESNRPVDAAEAADEVRMLLRKKDIGIHGSDLYTAMLRATRDEYEDLVLEHRIEDNPVRAENAGYFFSGYDGYESLRAEDYTAVTVSGVRSLMEAEPQSVPNNYVGKLLKDPEFYYYTVLDSEYAAGLTVGRKLTLEFELPTDGATEISVTVSHISAEEDGKRAVVFRGYGISSDMVRLRLSDAKILGTPVRGLQIPIAALRVVADSEGVFRDGVYTVSGSQLIFKPVTVLYSGADYAIVTPASSKITLLETDQVVVEGKDLFDRKILNLKGE